MNNKSRSLGRKTTEMNQMMLQPGAAGSMPYGKMNNIRDSSVSNTSNPNASSSLAAYASAANHLPALVCSGGVIGDVIFECTLGVLVVPRCHSVVPSTLRRRFRGQEAAPAVGARGAREGRGRRHGGGQVRREAVGAESGYCRLAEFEIGHGMVSRCEPQGRQSR